MTDRKTKASVSRLRISLMDYFNIEHDPFAVRNKEYIPLFKIKSQDREQQRRFDNSHVTGYAEEINQIEQINAAAGQSSDPTFDAVSNNEIEELLKEQEQDRKTDPNYK